MKALTKIKGPCGRTGQLRMSVLDRFRFGRCGLRGGTRFRAPLNSAEVVRAVAMNPHEPFSSKRRHRDSFCRYGSFFANEGDGPGQQRPVGVFKIEQCPIVDERTDTCAVNR